MLVRIMKQPGSASIELFEPLGPSGDLPSPDEGRPSTAGIEIQGLVQILLSPSLSANKRTEAAVKLASKSEPYSYVIIALVKALRESVEQRHEFQTLREAIRECLRHQLQLAIELAQGGRDCDAVTLQNVDAAPSRHGRTPKSHGRTPKSVHQESLSIPQTKDSAKSLAKAVLSLIIAHVENKDTPELPRRLQLARDRTTKLHWKMAIELERAINREYSGKDLGTTANKMEAIEAIRTQLRDHGMKVLCPRCHRAADLFVSSTQGAIRFRHVIDGRKQSHGGKLRLEELTLVPTSALNAAGEIVVPSGKAAVS